MFKIERVDKNTSIVTSLNGKSLKIREADGGVWFNNEWWPDNKGHQAFVRLKQILREK